MAEADAEIGSAKFPDEVADRGFLVDQPGKIGLLPDIHRPTHDDHKVESLKRRDLGPRIELYGLDVMSGRQPEIGEGAGMLDIEVLENQDAHRLIRF